MKSTRKKFGISLVLAAAAIPLALVSLAFGCGVLATLYLTPERVTSGSQLSGFGRNYSSSPLASAVDVRLDRRSGPVVWSGRPASTGLIKPSFTLPAGLKPGYHLLMAMQTNAGGTPSAGTPAKARVFVGTAAQRRAANAASGIWAPSPSGGGSGGASGPAIGMDTGLLAALLSGGLLAGGIALLRRRPTTGSIA